MRAACCSAGCVVMCCHASVVAVCCVALSARVIEDACAVCCRAGGIAVCCSAGCDVVCCRAGAVAASCIEWSARVIGDACAVRATAGDCCERLSSCDTHNCPSLSRFVVLSLSSILLARPPLWPLSFFLRSSVFFSLRVPVHLRASLAGALAAISEVWFGVVRCGAVCFGVVRGPSERSPRMCPRLCVARARSLLCTRLANAL